jgi:predicted RNase H-like nuclease (RuvC/YqgF family)
LLRLNSDLHQQNEILKCKVEKMEKRIVRAAELEGSPEKPADADRAENYEKVENYYKGKIGQMDIKIQEQKRLIENQNIKIKELSSCIKENSQLKTLLDKMEERVSEIRSGCSKEGSRVDSLEKMSEQFDSPKRGTAYFEKNGVFYRPPLNTSPTKTRKNKFCSLNSSATSFKWN